MQEDYDEYGPNCSELQDTGPGRCSTFTIGQKQESRFHDSARSRSTEGRFRASGASGRPGEHQGKRPVSVEPSDPKRQTQRCHSHRRELLVRLEHSQSHLNCDCSTAITPSLVHVLPLCDRCPPGFTLVTYMSNMEQTSAPPSSTMCLERLVCAVLS
jgi:hypothetical protein